MKRDIRLYLQDVWESILAIEEYTKNLTEEGFHNNRQIQDAVIRRLEIVGEATKNIDDDFRKKHPDIPWKKMAGMRDILIHEYFGVNLKRLWQVIRMDLPGLKQKFVVIMKEENDY